MTDAGSAAATTFAGSGRLFGWLERHQRGLIVFGIALQLVVLLASIAFRLVPFAGAETVLLKVVPIDPRDLMRGEYVILGYDFSRLPNEPIAGLPEDWRERRGQQIFVTLVPDADGRHWTAGEFQLDRPADGLYLEGRIGSGSRIEYGIESFFVEEGQGKRYERAIRDGTLSARVAVSKGKASLRELVFEPAAE